MGVNLKAIVSHEPIDFEDLKGRVIAIDALNSLYQFLASIRQPDGTPLMDSKKRVTSHLSGLLYRTVRLVQIGIKPVYVFDGEPPELKKKEIEERREMKEEAEYEWEKAKREKRLEDAKKFAMRTSRLTEEMLNDSKNLLDYMGIPCVQAPSEGEAQCVHLCIKGDAWAVGSQDYDSLLLGAPRLVRGLTLSGTFELSIVHLNKVLKELNLNREQLIDIAILVGTDFNEGVKGIGPKKALKIVREGRLDEIRKELDFDFNAVKEIFLNPKVTDEYRIEWNLPDKNSVVEILCGEHDFSEDRVKKAIGNLEKSMREFSQKGLSEWL
ncbi:MAG: flap endonuclease-1 [Candidatus Altiarchaeales archaeon]|mgnify:CR=1 FL=1|nr:MAG: flap endonuclease-1 [Candidatus Altiarchaeales archaeon]HDI73049.1 flap endonuclease-1 [Candidatus Altiarchaeales archaeon]